MAGQHFGAGLIVVSWIPDRLREGWEKRNKRTDSDGNADQHGDALADADHTSFAQICAAVSAIVKALKNQ